MSSGFHTFYVLFSGMAVAWEERKLFLEHSINFNSDALHTIGGVIVLLAAAAILRKPVSAALPWLIVLAATLGNELVDLSVQQWPHPGMQYGESVKDFLLSMCLPTLILVTARIAPWLYSPVKTAGTETRAVVPGPDPVIETSGAETRGPDGRSPPSVPRRRSARSSGTTGKAAESRG